MPYRQGRLEPLPQRQSIRLSKLSTDPSVRPRYLYDLNAGSMQVTCKAGPVRSRALDTDNLEVPWLRIQASIDE